MDDTELTLHDRLNLQTARITWPELERVQKVVTKEEVHKIRDELGDELFQFMQSRASRMKGKMEFQLRLPQNLSSRNTLILSGLLCLHAALGGYSLALRKRLMLKLPHEWFVLYKRSAVLGKDLNLQQAECAALIQKVAIEMRMGVGSDGQIHFG